MITKKLLIINGNIFKKGVETMGDECSPVE